MVNSRILRGLFRQLAPFRGFIFASILFALSTQSVLAADNTNTLSFNNPLNNTAKPYALADVVGLIVRGVLGITGILAAVFIMIGGARIIFAGGNEEQITKGKGTLLWAVLGLVIAFAGFVIVSYILTLSASFPGLAK